MAEVGASRVLMVGATGFVGRHLRVALEAAGYETRLASRSPERARQEDPHGRWVELDLDRPETLEPALEGCDAAYFLAHAVGAGGDYPERERRAAEAFAEAAAQAGVQRIVYLGGVAPAGEPSRHLASRLATGEALRAGRVPTVELRAAMVIGHGSTSWQMVRDLGVRLPAMLLPRWLGRHSWPVALDDVVHGLLAALWVPAGEGGCYDLPGPERIRHRDVLRRVAGRLGRRPITLGVPVLSPSLSSYWIGWVTSVDFEVARELVHGLVSDLEPTQPIFWDLLEGGEPTPLDEAIDRAIVDDRAGGMPTERTRVRLQQLARGLTEARAA